MLLCAVYYIIYLPIHSPPPSPALQRAQPRCNGAWTAFRSIPITHHPESHPIPPSEFTHATPRPRPTTSYPPIQPTPTPSFPPFPTPPTTQHTRLTTHLTLHHPTSPHLTHPRDTTWQSTDAYFPSFLPSFHHPSFHRPSTILPSFHPSFTFHLPARLTLPYLACLLTRPAC
jgi:hypothetical protein